MSDKEDLERLKIEYEMFAQTTSHDLRDPLRQAMADCDELHEKLTDKDSMVLLDNITTNINQVINKIADLRAYSYLVGATNKNEQVDCNSVMQDILKENEAKIKSRNAEVSYENLPIVNGNYEHLKVLFIRIIDNAIKFNESKPPIVKITAEDKGEHWKFEVKDNGVGLEDVYRKLVFTIFQKLQPEEKIESLGTGLTFAKRIASNHGGDVWYESDGESGTSFYFTIAK